MKAMAQTFLFVLVTIGKVWVSKDYCISFHNEFNLCSRTSTFIISSGRSERANASQKIFNKFLFKSKV